MRNDRRLLVFLRAPREGQVKTRLAREIGPVAALEAYRALLQRTLDAAADFGPVELRFTPSDALPLVEPLLRPGWTAVAQGDGDLGERLDSAFRDAFRDGFQRVMVVGSDCPEIGPEDLGLADERLSETDVVLGPAIDGGYWLLGLRRPAPFLFRDMPWSTPACLRRDRSPRGNSRTPPRAPARTGRCGHGGRLEPVVGTCSSGLIPVHPWRDLRRGAKPWSEDARSVVSVAPWLITVRCRPCRLRVQFLVGDWAFLGGSLPATMNRFDGSHIPSRLPRWIPRRRIRPCRTHR
jgi:rSAM/selenodomain-associated transferase 1